ncbi:MAG: Hsp20/alpha crystallin family protein [Taibaiella sp.]|jgi:HSP20 family protein
MSKHSLLNLKEIFPPSVDDFFTPWGDWFRKNNLFNHSSVPAMNITDENDHYKVTVAAPGLQKKDFDIDLDNNILTISASSEKEHEEEKKKYSRREYSYSSFSRSFSLPSDVKEDAIDAQYENGILTLNLPKNEQAKQAAEKKIEVR